MSIVRRGYGRNATNFALDAYGGFYNRASSAIRQRLARASVLSMRRRWSGPSRKKNRITSGQGITNQYDRKLIYAKKRMPKRRRVRWKKFIRKVQAATEKGLGSSTVVRNNLTTLQATTVLLNEAAQKVAHVGLYTIKNSSSADTEIRNDLHKFLSFDTRISLTSKVKFTSAVFDMTARCEVDLNAETKNPGGIRIEVDVYELTWSKMQPGEAGSMEAVWTTGASDTGTIPGTGFQALDLLTRGATPWDFPVAISQFGIKVYKKTKYHLSHNDTFTYQMRDPATHYFQRSEITDTNTVQENKPGLTKWLMIIAKPIAGYEYSDTNLDTWKLHLGCTRKYLYKINEVEEDRDCLV